MSSGDMRLAIGANLALLFVVGATSKDLIASHKRLAFTIADFDLLAELMRKAECVVSTPNALTELSNIAEFGLSAGVKKSISDKLAALVPAWDEQYVPSSIVVVQKEFSWLGLTDCAWLCLLDAKTHLLTVDHNLYQAALKRGLNATNFNHLREGFGTL